ncbi:MAG: hypothetical protein QGG34_13470 [SAR202 cluster bacterium]|jgi:hypothetical protein|nr:hypothetical protein [SAR202 cluster bacterium]MDP6301462.1 hypothetical protein [SAR202 cluster bacterium]MDP7105002.1 hypothetical protein [SAR202 cluster bacterium]
MPSKRRRAATRQAQLSQRKRRSRNRPLNIGVSDQETAPAAVSESGQSDTSDGGVDAVAEPQPAVIPAQPRTTSRPSRPTRRRTAARVDPLPTYSYLDSELRRIGAMTAVIVVLLGVLTAVLR